MSVNLGGEGSQAGDADIENIAGRDIYHGAPPDQLIQLVLHQIDKDSQYRMLMVDVQERQHKQVLAELRVLRLIIVAGILVTILILALT